MTMKIGFCDTENENNNSSEMQQAETPVVAAPKCSVVEVGFPGRDGSLSYYNDRFDLHCGDWVFVEGEMEGLRGTVDKVSYKDGEARNLMCSCFKSGNCRHGVAALFQLRETLGYIEDYYTKQYEASGYFAAIFKGVFIPETVNIRNTGEISMSL